jgi:hypothetical protein
MSRRLRVEHGDALTLLAELPSGWAQSVITAPPAGDPGYVLAVLAQARRVLRAEGTLWISPPAGQASPITRGLREGGWITVPAGSTGRLTLFAKQTAFLSHARATPERRAPESPPAGLRAAQVRRRAECIPARAASAISERAAAACVAASTVPLVCGACGAPYQRRSRGGRQRWRATCIHHDDQGRCLVLDPFCADASTAVAALRRGRAFLGITAGQPQARAIQARIERELGGQR